MKRFVLLAVLGAFLTAAAFAQQGPGRGDPNEGPPPELLQRMEQAREGARTDVMRALSSDHQAQVNAVVTRVKAGQLADLHVATQEIDAALTPKEAQVVLAARDKMMAGLRGARSGSSAPPDGGTSPNPPSRDGGPGPGPPPRPGDDLNGGPPEERYGPPPEGGRRLAGHALHDDAGFALLFLSLDPDHMRSLFMNSRPPQ